MCVYTYTRMRVYTSTPCVIKSVFLFHFVLHAYHVHMRGIPTPEHLYDRPYYCNPQPYPLNTFCCSRRAAQARRVPARYVHRPGNVTRYRGLYDVIAYTCVYDKRCTGDYTAAMYTYVCHPAHVLIIIIIVVRTRLARARPAYRFRTSSRRRPTGSEAEYQRHHRRRRRRSVIIA